jgi:hypothetical protein
MSKTKKEETPTVKATEEKEEKLTAKELREEEREACNREIQAVLAKYNCDLTAQVIVNEHRIVPQVFVVDARS